LVWPQPENRKDNRLAEAGRFSEGTGMAIRERESRIDTAYSKPFSADLTGRRKKPKLGPESMRS
jgi:hypothetical protein